MIQLCASQQLNDKPYLFKGTGTRVFSLEEVLFHVYGHWRQVADEFLSDEMVAWVGAIGHGYLAARMRELARREEFSKRLTGFLGLIEYFDAEQMEMLAGEMEVYEKERQWEALKQQADEHVREGRPVTALPLYRRAMEYEHNAELTNNYGVALLMMGQAEAALRIFTRALALAPNSRQIMLHYVEAAIMADLPERAERRLQRVLEAGSGCAHTVYLQGLAAAKAKNYEKALALFADAKELGSLAVFAIIDVHLAQRGFDAAFAALEALPPTGCRFAKEAEIHAAARDHAGAARALQRATLLGQKDARTHTRWATHLRAAKDAAGAEIAIKRAVALFPDDDSARLEAARIKKARGQTAEYRAQLTEILAEMKERYRAALE